jgi:hypothetical protein
MYIHVKALNLKILQKSPYKFTTSKRVNYGGYLTSARVYNCKLIFLKKIIGSVLQTDHFQSFFSISSKNSQKGHLK